MTFMSKPDTLFFSSLLLGKEKLHLGEGFARLRKLEAQNLPIFASPWRRLLHLSEGPRLGEGPLRLGEPKVQFFPFPSINSRNHYSFVRTLIEVNDKHEIGLVDDPNK